MRHGLGMFLMAAVSASIMLLSCSSYDGGKAQDIIEKDIAIQDDIAILYDMKPEDRLLMVNDKLYCGTAQTGPMGDAGAVEGKIDSVSQTGIIPEQNGQSNFGGIGCAYTQDYGDGFIMVLIGDEWFCFYEQPGSEKDEPPEESTELNIPWGFDAVSYQIYKSGALDSFIANGSEVDQCIIADLDMDGRDDILLSCSIPDSSDEKDIHSYGLNTLLLKGIGGGAYKLDAENQNTNYFSSYDGSAVLSAGEGWFKLTRGRGTAGGYVHSYFFEYDQKKEDWFLNTYYSNWYGYIEEGRSVMQTPDNFGSISFKDFDSSMARYLNKKEGIASEEEMSVDETDFKISVSTCYVTLKDKEKEYRINKVITEHIASMINEFRDLDTNVDILLQGGRTYETPQIICLEYRLNGAIDSDEMNYSGTNRKYITAMFDIEKARQITLSDLVDIETLYGIMKQEGVVYRSPDSDIIWKIFDDMEKEECIELLKSADHLQAALGAENTGIFSAIYEKSLCLYFQPEFIGMSSYSGEPMIYIPLEAILPEIKLNYWELPEKGLSHIEWKG